MGGARVISHRCLAQAKLNGSLQECFSSSALHDLLMDYYVGGDPQTRLCAQSLSPCTLVNLFENFPVGGGNLLNEP
ncbi:hypothetical protein ROHU_004097 [Labeo rohita]|uniref:Uncharacterized protein n=1 Tax=Labeo rohita TaxID=84645 RepID=A0A498NQX1_LABRO|nr:hypothetical protein ROHU_004097 [Labeo rohita]